MLTVSELHSYYGPSHVLHGVSLQLPAGQVLGILGRNGMGKTTLARSILGLSPPDVRSGVITLNGEPIGDLPVPQVARHGIGIVPQGRRVFASLTVAETLSVAERAGEKKSGGFGWTRAEVEDLFPVLGQRPRQRAQSLSGGEQAMLSIARALLARPRVLVMDEPSEGLAPVVVDDLIESLRSLKERGMTILLIEQNMHVARELADRVLIIERGIVVASFDSHEFDDRWDEVRSRLGV